MRLRSAPFDRKLSASAGGWERGAGGGINDWSASFSTMDGTVFTVDDKLTLFKEPGDAFSLVFRDAFSAAGPSSLPGEAAKKLVETFGSAAGQHRGQNQSGCSSAIHSTSSLLRPTQLAWK